MRAWTSGVSGGSSRVSSSAGSPIGSEPRGSSRAFRWPCMRYALTSDIAAATAPTSSPSAATSGAGGASAVGAGAGSGGATGSATPTAGPSATTSEPFPSRRTRSATRRSSPGNADSTSMSPASKSARQAGSTASGFSRYCSRSCPTYPAFRPEDSRLVTVRSSGAASVDPVVRHDCDGHADDERGSADEDRDRRESTVRFGHPRRHEGQHDRRGGEQRRGARDRDPGESERERAQEPRNAV